LALFTSASRVLDFKHHVHDVVLSAFIGSVVAFVVHLSPRRPKSSSVQAFRDSMYKSQSCQFHWHYDELVS
jgi:membrane-associated phospholipid phosphatase